MPTNASACFQTAGGTSILNIKPSTMSEADVKTKAERELRTAKDPIEKLRYKLLTRGASGIKEFGRLFRRLDENKNSTLSKAELGRLIAQLKLGYSDAEIGTVFAVMDKDGSGEVSFDEFLLALRPPLNECRLSLIDKAFQKLDKTGDGVVTSDDLKDTYNHTKHPKFVTGQWSKEEVLKEFLKNFEIGGHVDGIVTREEFINYYSGISAAIDTDVYFDLMMRNAWKL